MRRADETARHAAAERRDERHAAAAAGTVGAGRRAALRQSLDAELLGRYAFLSARLLHDEVQPEAERAARRAAGPGGLASLSAGIDAPGNVGAAALGAAQSGRNRRAAGRLAAAGRRGARRNDGHARGRRLFPRSRARAHDRADSRRRPRHQSRQRRDGRLQDRHGQEPAGRVCRYRRSGREARRARRPCS